MNESGARRRGGRLVVTESTGMTGKGGGNAPDSCVWRGCATSPGVPLNEAVGPLVIEVEHACDAVVRPGRVAVVGGHGQGERPAGLVGRQHLQYKISLAVSNYTSNDHKNGLGPLQSSGIQHARPFDGSKSQTTGQRRSALTFARKNSRDRRIHPLLLGWRLRHFGSSG